MAQPFDVGRLEPFGEAVPIAEQVGSYIDVGLFSPSSNGVLAYRNGSGLDYQLRWLDQQGRVLGTVAEPGRYNSIALSPDERRVAVSRTNPDNTPNWDVWLLDLGRNTSTRLTYDQVRATFPVWSADGSSVIFDSVHEGESNLYLKSANGNSSCSGIGFAFGSVIGVNLRENPLVRPRALCRAHIKARVGSLCICLSAERSSAPKPGKRDKDGRSSNSSRARYQEAPLRSSFTGIPPFLATTLGRSRNFC